MRDGRINMCGITTKNVDYVSKAFYDVITKFPGTCQLDVVEFTSFAKSASTAQRMYVYVALYKMYVIDVLRYAIYSSDVHHV